MHGPNKRADMIHLDLLLITETAASSAPQLLAPPQASAEIVSAEKKQINDKK